MLGLWCFHVLLTFPHALFMHVLLPSSPFAALELRVSFHKRSVVRSLIHSPLGLDVVRSQSPQPSISNTPPCTLAKTSDADTTAERLCTRSPLSPIRNVVVRGWPAAGRLPGPECSMINTSFAGSLVTQTPETREFCLLATRMSEASTSRTMKQNERIALGSRPSLTPHAAAKNSWFKETDSLARVICPAGTGLQG